MALFNSFTFDGENSLESGVYITGEAVFNAPERVVEMVSVPGRDGDIAIDEGRFENIPVTYPAGCFADNMADFAEKIANFRNILAARFTYKRLTDTYHPEEFRKGVYRSGLEVDAVQQNRAGEFDIEFDCMPQRWLVSGETAQTFAATGTITNPTLFGAKPLLKVTGAGNLTVGERTMTLIARSSSSSVLWIDCDSQEAWEVVSGANVSRNDYVQNAGELFPVLNGGENDVILGSGITRVEIVPRWWRV